MSALKGGEDMSRFLMPLSEYNRIHQVAHGVLRDVGRPEKACKFFACFGAMVLTKHYKIPARAVAGGFALCINDTPEVAFFGQIDHGRISTSSEGFHMWVQTETHVIDFMAPIFPEAFADGAWGVKIPRRMFQRRLLTESESLDGLTTIGAFYTLPDPYLTEDMVDDFFNQPANIDLLNVGNAWYGGRTRKQPLAMAMQDNLGEVFQLQLPSTTAMGSW